MQCEYSVNSAGQGYQITSPFVCFSKDICQKCPFCESKIFLDEDAHTWCLLQDKHYCGTLLSTGNWVCFGECHFFGIQLKSSHFRHFLVINENGTCSFCLYMFYSKIGLHPSRRYLNMIYTIEALTHEEDPPVGCGSGCILQ